jgi:hypothetical protein
MIDLDPKYYLLTTKFSHEIDSILSVKNLSLNGWWYSRFVISWRVIFCIYLVRCPSWQFFWNRSNLFNFKTFWFSEWSDSFTYCSTESAYNTELINAIQWTLGVIHFNGFCHVTAKIRAGICGLVLSEFNEEVGSSIISESSCRVSDEMGRDMEGSGGGQSRYCPCICLQGHRKTTVV